MTERFESAWEAYHGAPAVALSSWAGGAMAALHFAGVAGETVLCPSNTFMATPLAAIRAGARGAVRRLQPRGPVRVVRLVRGGRRAPQAKGRVRRAHRRPHRVRDRADRGLLPRARDLPDRGLRARPRRRVERAPGRDLGRRGHLLAVRDQDDLHRRGRRARLDAPGAGRAHARVSQLRQADVRRPRPQLPDERVHRRARADPDRAACGDRGVEECGGAPRARRPVPGQARVPRRHDLRPLQVHRVRLARALHRARLRRAVPPHPRPSASSCRTATGWRATTPACPCTTGPQGRADARPGHRRLRVHRLPRRRQAAGAWPRAGDLRPAARRRGTPTPPTRSIRGSARSPTARRSSARCTAATRSPTSPPSPTSTMSTPRPRTPSGSTPGAPSRCSRRPAAPASSGSSTRARSGSTPTAGRRRSTRRRCCLRRATSTRARSWPASSTARPTRSCTGSTTRSCGSGSRTARARARPR